MDYKEIKCFIHLNSVYPNQKVEKFCTNMSTSNIYAA